MNKLLTKVAKILLGLSLAAGVGVAIGSNKRVIQAKADTVSMSYTDAQGQGASGSGGPIEVVKSPITFNFTKSNGNTSYTQIYASGTLTVSGATITQIVITATNSTYIRSWSANTGSVSVSGSTATWGGSASSVTLTNTANAQVRATGITVTYTSGSTPQTDFDVTYMAGAGTGTNYVDEDQSGTYELLDPIDDCGFVAPSGQSFVGWSVSIGGGSATMYEVGDEINVSAAVVATAQWQKVVSQGEITYVFTSKSWAATIDQTAENWTSGKDGNQLTSGQGIQVSTGVSGANGTSTTYFKNVSQISVRYCTNASSGVGTIKVAVGSNAEQSFSVTKPSSGGTTLKNAVFTYSPKQEGKITITGLCTTNSVFIYGVTITCGAPQLSAPTGVSYDNSNERVTWNSVANASGYAVSVDGGSYTSTGVSGTAFDTSNLTKDVQHTIQVKALGDGGTNYNDSEPSTSYAFTPTVPAIYTSVNVTGGSLQGEYKGTAYIQCQATAQGSNLPVSPSFTWYITENNTYATTTLIANKASIDNDGKVTFLDNTTVYVWALAPDNSTHNSSGFVAQASGLVSPKGAQDNPYSVTEAWNIIDAYEDNGNSTSVLYVTGVVSGTPDDNNYGSTFNITDGVKTLKAYSISGAQSSDSSEEGYVNDGYTVVVGGALIKYKNNQGEYTYEVGYKSGFSSSLVSSVAPKTISSISVKTAPTKTAYKSGETFVATGLVITATYSDSTTEDIPYVGNEASFSFSPTTIIAACNVQITYREHTCNQAVTLIAVTNVTSVASAPSEVYKDATISTNDVTLNVTYADSSVGTVHPDSVSCDTSELGQAIATATYNAATGTKTSTFNVEVVREPSYDYIVDELVVGDTGISGTTYESWSGVTKTSGAVYAGNTNENSNGGIGMRQDNSKAPSGIIVTSSPGVVTKVQVTWTTTTSRTIHVKGQNTAYSSIEYAADFTGTEVGTIEYSATSADLSSEYKYICIYVTGGAVGLSSIKITWKVESAADPLTANPILSTGSEAEVHVGKNIALGITTTPVDSDEKLIVTSSNTDYVTVSGSGRSYTIHGVAVGSATVTVAGAEGNYSSSVLITVSVATKTYEDKIMTPDDLGLVAYETSDTTHTFDGVDFITKQVMKSGGFQFKKNEGYLYNNESLYASNNIKAITLIMRSSNVNEPQVYEGAEAGEKTTLLSSKDTFVANGVNTYEFSGSTQFFRIDANADGAVNIEKIIIEMEDSSSSILSKARSAASAILSGLSGLCGEGGSGLVTQSVWNSINSALTALSLSADDKLFLKNADRILLDNLAQGGATIENAMAHYDACVTKFGLTPFTDITNAQASPNVTPLAGFGGNTNTIAIIVIISMVSVTAIGGYFFIRRRKEN